MLTSTSFPRARAATHEERFPRVRRRDRRRLAPTALLAVAGFSAVSAPFLLGPPAASAAAAAAVLVVKPVSVSDTPVHRLRVADDGSIVSPPARARIAVKRTLPATGLHVETAMEATAVLLSVGTTLLLIRRKRRESR